MFYAFVLFLHSWLRWLVLVAGVVLLVRAASGARRGEPWQPRDQRAGAAYLASLDTQVLLGLLLYFFVSPVTPRSLGDLHTFMTVPTLRFFAVEHAFGMIVAAVAAHVGWARGRRSPNDQVRYKRVLVGVIVSMIAVLVSIPWPFLPYGRPLFRTF